MTKLSSGPKPFELRNLTTASGKQKHYRFRYLSYIMENLCALKNTWKLPSGWPFTLFTIICAQLLLLYPSASLGARPDSGAMPMYNYMPGSPSGPDEWGTLSPNWTLCMYGQQQSPIAIDVAQLPVNQSLGSLQYTYMPSEGVLVNLGHTLQVNFGAGAGNLVLDGDIYDLKQFHFHTPSEHIVNNERFPLEMHLVHKTSDGQKLAVIGVIFWKSCHGHFLEQFWDSLPNVIEKGANMTIGPVSFQKLHIGPSYARYSGSLTTPPCTQNVSWTVELSQGTGKTLQCFKCMLWNTVSQSQLDDLKTIITEPNARPLQSNIGSVEIY